MWGDPIPRMPWLIAPGRLIPQSARAPICAAAVGWAQSLSSLSAVPGQALPGQALPGQAFAIAPKATGRHILAGVTAVPHSGMQKSGALP